MTQDQQTKAKILTSLLEGRLSTAEAAQALGWSQRHLERIRPRFRRDGIAALVHGNRGKHAWNAKPEATRKLVVELLERKYVNFTHQHATDLMRSIEGLDVSRHTVRRLALATGHPTPKPQKRRSKHRARRERRAREGELLQMDGSPHDWLEGRGPRLTLITAVDDATGRKWARFREGEDLQGYVEVIRDVILERGVPEGIYTDSSAIAVTTKGKNRERPIAPRATQLARMLDELNAYIIVATSAPAKGRVERSHSTDQDRLVSLLRLANACTLEEASLVLQFYLEDANGRFVVQPADPTLAWRPAPPLRQLQDILCLKEHRKVANDNTVRVYGRIINVQAGPRGSSYSGTTVTIHRRFDLTVGVFHNGARVGGEPPRPYQPPPKQARPAWLTPYVRRPTESLIT